MGFSLNPNADITRDSKSQADQFVGQAVGLPLSMATQLYPHIKKEICEVVGSFLSFLTKYDKNSQYVVSNVIFKIQEFDINFFFYWM